jgi:hypothetical protein
LSFNSQEKEGNMKISRDEIIKKMEQLKEGEFLKFNIPVTFGGGIAIIGLNPNHSEKGGKKYLLQTGKDENVKPYWDTDKAKDLAKWTADRMGDLSEGG